MNSRQVLLLLLITLLCHQISLCAQDVKSGGRSNAVLQGIASDLTKGHDDFPQITEGPIFFVDKDYWLMDKNIAGSMKQLYNSTMNYRSFNPEFKAASLKEKLVNYSNFSIVVSDTEKTYEKDIIKLNAILPNGSIRPDYLVAKTMEPLIIGTAPGPTSNNSTIKGGWESVIFKENVLCWPDGSNLTLAQEAVYNVWRIDPHYYDGIIIYSHSQSEVRQINMTDILEQYRGGDYEIQVDNFAIHPYRNVTGVSRPVLVLSEDALTKIVNAIANFQNPDRNLVVGQYYATDDPDRISPLGRGPCWDDNGLLIQLTPYELAICSQLIANLENEP